MMAVFAAAVILVLPIVATKEELPVAVPILTEPGKVKVTPAGMLLKVKRICEELSTPVPLLAFCVFVLQQLAQPSVRMNAPIERAIFLFVKTVAVPAPGLVEEPPMVELPGARPIASDAIPGFNEVMMVPLEGAPNR